MAWALELTYFNKLQLIGIFITTLYQMEELPLLVFNGYLSRPLERSCTFHFLVYHFLFTSALSKIFQCYLRLLMLLLFFCLGSHINVCFTVQFNVLNSMAFLPGIGSVAHALM